MGDTPEVKSTVTHDADRWTVQTGEMVTVFRDCEAAACQIATLQGEILKLREEAAWVRRKVGLPESAQFLSGRPAPTLAGTLHILCSDAYGMRTYINAYKCDDKQGEIARQAVEIERLRRENQAQAEIIETDRQTIETMKRWQATLGVWLSGMGHTIQRLERLLGKRRAKLARLHRYLKPIFPLPY